MIFYVAHKYEKRGDEINRALKIVHDLAVKDMSNTYICPITALLHFGTDEIPKLDEMEQRYDLLCCCEKLIVASEVTEDVQKEIAMAKRLQMEVVYLE